MPADRVTEPSQAADARVAAALHGRRLAIRALAVAVAVALLTAGLLALPGLEDVRARLAGVTAGGLGTILALELLSSFAFVLAFREVFSRRLSWRLSYDAAMATMATNVVVPTGGAGGLALGGWALTRAGMPSDRVARRAVALFVLTSIPNFTTAAVAGGLLALGLAEGDVPVLVAAVPAVLATLTIVLVALAPRLLRSTVAQRRRRVRVAAEALVGGIEDAGRILRRGRLLMVAGVFGLMTFDVLALAAAFAALADVPPAAALALAYVLGQLGGLVPTPGGVGGTDGGLIGALALCGTPLAEATAAVLAYRAFQLGVPVALGLLAAVRLPRTVQRSAAAGAKPVLRPRTAPALGAPIGC